MRLAQPLVLATGLLAAGFGGIAPALAFDPAEVAKLAAEGNCIYCDLSGLDQPGLALPGANLSGSNLSQANLSGADLSEAQLSASDLTGAKLGGALLAEAKLDRALLAGADLSNADLSGASLRHADLRDANLAGAELSYADLFGADLRGTDLTSTDLSQADLRWAKVQDLLAPGEAAKLEGAVATGADLRFVKGLTPEMSAKLCGDPETRHSLEDAVLWFCEPLEKAAPDAAPIAASFSPASEKPIAAPAPAGSSEVKLSNVAPADGGSPDSGPAESKQEDSETYPGGKMDAVEVVPVEQQQIPAGEVKSAGR